jgi:hypothetical protein
MRMAGVRAGVPKPLVMKILHWVASPQTKYRNWYGVFVLIWCVCIDIVCLYLQIYVCLQNSSRPQYKRI